MANFPAIMEYPAEFLRGWPVDGALELSYPIKAGETLKVGNTVTISSAGEILATTADTAFSGIVVRGNADDKSVAASNKAIVLWGHYIVKVSTKAADALVTQGDVSALAFGSVVGGNASGAWGLVTGGNGVVMEKNTTDQYVIIAVS